MPNGKPAGVRCIQLDSADRCTLFGRPERPEVCRRLKPEPAMCGANRMQALATLSAWEAFSAPR